MLQYAYSTLICCGQVRISRHFSSSSTFWYRSFMSMWLDYTRPATMDTYLLAQSLWRSCWNQAARCTCTHFTWNSVAEGFVLVSRSLRQRERELHYVCFVLHRIRSSSEWVVCMQCVGLCTRCNGSYTAHQPAEVNWITPGRVITGWICVTAVHLASLVTESCGSELWDR
jgi:hypothetical protein